MEKVIKRNGDIVDYSGLKIENAITNAYLEVYPNKTSFDAIATAVAVKCMVEAKFLDTDSVKVEDIQDAVEDSLMLLDKEVSKAYIRYRHTHAMARDKYTELVKELMNKIAGKNIVNQNANVDEHSFGGRYGETADLLMKKLALEYYLSPKARENHEGNMIYVHDLSHYILGDHNCLSIPFDDLLKNSFDTRQTDVRGAQSVGTALQLIAVIFQLQSLNQFGGVSATHIDWTLVPYIRKSFWKHYLDGLYYAARWDKDSINSEELAKENVYLNHEITDEDFYEIKAAREYAMDMTAKELHQGVEGLYHNLNTLQSRSGNQLPFTSINYGTCTLPEGRMAIKEILDVSIEGIGTKKTTSVFPCGIFQSMEGVNRKPGDPNYDLFRLALKSTATRLYPNYANVEWSGNAGFDRSNPETYFSTMGKCKCSSYKTF